MVPADIFSPTRASSVWSRFTERDSCSTGPVGVLVKLHPARQAATPTNTTCLTAICLPQIEYAPPLNIVPRLGSMPRGQMWSCRWYAFKHYGATFAIGPPGFPQDGCPS